MKNKIVLKVNKEDASRWTRLMKALGEKELPKLVEKWEVLGLGKFDKKVFSSTVAIPMMSIHDEGEKYVIELFKKKFKVEKISELLHPVLLKVVQPDIDNYIRQAGDFRGRFDEQRHNVIGLKISNLASLNIENLPLDGDKLNVSDVFIQDIVDRFFTTYIESPVQEKLYKDLRELCNQMMKIAADWKHHTGLTMDRFKDDLLKYDDDGTIKPDIDNVIWFMSFMEEYIPVG